MDKLIIVWNEKLMFKHGIGLTLVEDLSVDLSLDDSTHLVTWLYKCVSSLTRGTLQGYCRVWLFQCRRQCYVANTQSLLVLF